MSNVRTCTRCVMNDGSDRTIIFDEKGRCNYCTHALEQIHTTTYFPGEDGRERLHRMLETIKTENRDKAYDCVMGISGGLDSAYLAYLGHQWGLRILAVHIDDGFDTEISKENIHRLCEEANIELRTITPDPTQFYDLLLAYMKAGVPNLAIPQDNVLLSFLFDTVEKEHLRYFLSGGNFALESILQQDHVFNSMDTVNIHDIHRRYGTEPMDRLSLISSYRKYLAQKTRRVVSYRPLNYIDYNRERAFRELNEFCGFTYYGSKHLENIFTAFVQLYWLPLRYGVDKRTSHYSSMIVSGQMTREQALAELKKPICDSDQMESYIGIICDKLSITRAQLDEYVNAPVKEHDAYRTDRLAKVLRRFIRR